MADEIDNLNQKTVSLEREIHLLLRKIEKLEVSVNHQRVLLELKENEIRGLKQKLEDLNDDWKKENDVIDSVKDELIEKVREMFIKVDELEKKLEIQENVISNSRYFGVNVEWLVMTASIVVAVISIGVSYYHRDGRKP
ncbi:hypothetical protein R3W88_032835 [Solanum pinnatisectum]|uniref:Uncharacterized protein n=1 Tax=Solanum pinnatisectum TaxID=50273 RepID=A0AAV9LR76_9SOLN|nr:hypothetical protein R3W88_032835 [Solanum pinnatisectum]